MKSATEQYYEGLLREKNRNAWTDVSKQIGEVYANPVKPSQAVEPSQTAETLREDEKEVEGAGVTRAWRSLSSDVGYSLRREDL